MTREQLQATLLALSTLITLSAGCANDLPKATEITRMRVLGSQISVIGDETRATPKPGESVHISFVTAFPDLDSNTEESQMMIVSCTAPDRFTGGLPICQELIDAAESGTVDSGSVLTAARKVECSDIPGRRQTFAGVTVACVNGPPEIDLSIPASFSAGSSMFLGVVCERGDAYFDPTSTTLFGCDDNDGETIGLHGVYPVQKTDEDVNHNPDISKLSIEMAPFIEWHPIDGTAMAEADGLPEDCAALATMAGPTFPGVDVGEHQLTLRFPAEERERALNEPGEPFESLEISVHATSGEIERQFTVFTNESESYGAKRGDVPIDTEPPWLEEDVFWDPSNAVTASGQLVRFFVTARDQRGGFSMSTYAACVR
jgi:hypothetical protein